MKSLLPGAVLALILSCSLPALGQPSGADKALAEALFRDGRELLSAGKFSDACPKFAESQRLDPRLGTLLNLAICHEKEGKTASAWGEFTDVAALAGRQGEADREAFAREHAQELSKKLSRLRVVVAAQAPSPEVKLDGKVLGSGAWGTAIPLDPGEHQIEAQAPGKRPWSQRIQIAAGPASTSVDVPLLPDAAAAPVAPAASAPAAAAPSAARPSPSSPPTSTGPDEARAPGGWRRPAGWAGVGVGALGLGLGTYFGLVTLGKHSDSKGECDASGCSAKGHELQQDAIRASRWSTGAFAVGLIGGAAGLYLLLTPASSRASASLSPAVAPGFSGLRLQGGF